MLRIDRVLLRGKGQQDAGVKFDAGSNILAGESDTGKSLTAHCLDYIFGADKLKKRIPEIEKYSQMYVQFSNEKGQFLTLERSLSGGNLKVYRLPINDIGEEAASEIIAPKRKGKSTAKDVTSILFPFAGINEARLRKNDRGDTVRLTIRTMLPLIIVDEISVISDWSPVLGQPGYDDTPRKRMFAYMLSGKDDEGIVAAEKREIVRTRLNAQLGVINNLLDPLEIKLQKSIPADPEENIERIEETILSISNLLTERTEERAALYRERQENQQSQQRAESQLIAIRELSRQYDLLDERYRSDLDRLDFVAEGSHFFEGLQEVECPLCDQLMSPDHIHNAAEAGMSLYEAARAEAAKILAHRKDLASAILSLEERRILREKERADAAKVVQLLDRKLDDITPALASASQRLDRLIARRIDLETLRNDNDQAQSLRKMKQQIEQASKGGVSTKDWEPLPASALRKLCAEIEAILAEWNWKGERRVEFDQEAYDIIVDGQSRLSHGKGVRALLYSAFAIGLLRYCLSHEKPHPGAIIIDSPLTSYKKGKASTNASDGPVDQGMEAAFWKSLPYINGNAQIIVIENKEPPREVAKKLHYEWFAGDNAGPNDRVAFVPKPLT